MTDMTDRINGALSSTAIKAPCRYVTTGNISLSGLGTRTGGPWASSLSDGDRILVVAQTDGTQNGIYVASSSSWNRAPDFNGNRDVVRGTRIPIASGATYEVKTADPITIDTDTITIQAPESGTERVSVLTYYSGSGDFDEAVSAAYTECVNRGGGIVWFPWRLAGYTLSMITVSHPKVHFCGDEAEIIYRWSAASQSAGLSGGTYRASPAFLVKSTAGNNKFRGLRFSQYAGFPTTYSGSFTSAATFAAIIIQGADHVNIQECHFDSDSGRVAYWRGGNYGVFRNNVVLNGSVVAHIGEVSDTLFWDDSTDISTRYSPWLLSVDNNVFVGSNTTRLAPHTIFMTGVVAPSVCDNRLYGLSVDGASSGDGIRVYANDLGMYNQDGTGRTKHQLIVRGNEIFGTVGAAIQINGDSDYGSDTSTYGSVTGNEIDVTGFGILVERGQGLKLGYNQVISSSSPLVLSDDCQGLNSFKNRYECTGTGESNHTIQVRSTSYLTNVWFDGDEIWSSASDVYIMDTSNVTRGFEAGGFRGCTLVFRSQSTSSRILQLSESQGSVTVDNNTFDIRDTGITNRYFVSIDEAAGAATTVYFRGNKALSNNSVSFVSRGAAINNSDTCFVENNDIGNIHIICSGDAFVSDNNITNSVAAVVPLSIEGASRAFVHDNTIRHTLTTNAICAEFIDCASVDCHDNHLAANSTSVMVRATSSGIVKVHDNVYSNQSTGAPVGVTGSALIGGDLGAYFSTYSSGTLWSDANRVSASICRPGTRFWNSSDNAYNDSNGSGWYLAGSAT